MKKTFNINLAGYPFIIDEDAYSLLNEYLHTIEHAFKKITDSQELTSDIEGRAAELLNEGTSGGIRIVTLSDVEKVIARIGKPEEMIEEDDSFTFEETTDSEGIEESEFSAGEGQTVPPIPPLPLPRKKLYRDPQGAMLGGVCSGLSWYINFDVTWIRLALVLLTIFSASTFIIIYIILWLVIPEAVTPLQRMQMMGERPTMETIGKTVTDTFREDRNIDVPEPEPSFGNPNSSWLNSLFKILVKVVIIIGLIIGTPILAGLLLGILGCLFALIMAATCAITYSSTPWGSGMTPMVVWGSICAIGIMLTLIIPLYVIVRKGFRSNRPMSKGQRKFLIILWISAFVVAAISAPLCNNMKRHPYTHNHQEVTLIEEPEQINEIPLIDDLGLMQNPDTIAIDALAME